MNKKGISGDSKKTIILKINGFFSSLKNIFIMSRTLLLKNIKIKKTRNKK